MKSSKLILLATALILSACSRDIYTMQSGAPIANTDKYDSDLKQCVHEANVKYMQSGCAGCKAFGLFGALVDSSTNAVDINKETQSCMNHHGYIGTSAGHD